MSDTEAENGATFKAGLITIVGRPNVGKSTLMNALLGEKLAITAPRPQTTRDQIRGIVNRPGMQLVFVDTPGIHDAQKALNKVLVRRAIDALAGVDAIVFVIDALEYVDKTIAEKGGLHKQDTRILEMVRQAGVPAIAVINKIDLVRAKSRLLPIADEVTKTGLFSEVFFVSALKLDGNNDLLAHLETLAPEGVPLFDPDIISDAPIRFHVAEIVREGVFRLTRDEVPYATVIEIERFDESVKPIEILARIVVEKSSQKGILVGKEGDMIRRIRIGARRRIRTFLGEDVRLELHVSVSKDWSHSDKGLRRFGLE